MTDEIEQIRERHANLSNEGWLQKDYASALDRAAVRSKTIFEAREELATRDAVAMRKDIATLLTNIDNIRAVLTIDVLFWLCEACKQAHCSCPAEDVLKAWDAVREVRRLIYD
jgi:hypothetical protein